MLCPRCRSKLYKGRIKYITIYFCRKCKYSKTNKS